jgi:restriction endonuclease S subunit
LVKLGEVCEIERGASPRPINDFITDDINGVNWIKIGDGNEGEMYINSTSQKITIEGAKKSRKVSVGDLILSNSMSFGKPYILQIDGYIHDGWLALRNIRKDIVKVFLYYSLSSYHIYNQFSQLATGGVVNNLNSTLVRGVSIPLPPLEVQREIVDKIELERKVVDGCRELIAINEGKIKKVIDRVWEE